MVDDCYFFQMEKEKATKHSHPDLIYIKDTIETDDPQTIPLWLFGFLY